MTHSSFPQKLSYTLLVPPVLGLTGWPGFCYAAAALAESDSTVTAELLQMIWSLLLVIALILVLYAFLRKRFSLTAIQQGKSIHILEMRPLPGRKSLCLVEIEGKRLLLGIAENNISSLAEFSGKENFDNTLQYCQQKMAPSKEHLNKQQEQG